MTSLLGPVELSAVTAALLVLPVAPALYELHKRNDAGPLLTSRHDGRIANFANSFRARLEPLRTKFEQSRAVAELSQTSIEGMPVLLVGSSDFDFAPDQLRGVEAIMCNRARVPADRIVDADLYALETLDVGENAVIRAAAAGNVTLRENSAILRWLHADGNIFLREQSSSYGRLSAGRSIHLEEGSCFQRMHAPEIVTKVDIFTDDGATASPPIGSGACRIDGLDDDGSQDADLFIPRRRIRTHEDFFLAASEALNANIVSTGEIRLGPGARVFGSIKSYCDMVIEDGACVHGSIFCGRTLRIGQRCFVTGPIMGSGDVLIGSGSTIGRLDVPTSVCSRSIRIASGCWLHGTVWAREQGTVES